MKPLYFLSFAFLFFVLLAFQLQTSAQAVADPPSIPVYKTTGTITLDGQLLEDDWIKATSTPHLMYKMGGVPSGNSNTPTDGVVVKPPYTDMSTCYVSFLRNGYDLYIALNSNDAQVCQFDWEGDGMFMKIKNASGANEYEIKNYVGSNPEFVFETNAPSGVTEGVGYPLPGTTIFDSTDVDPGYTAETVIHLDQLGFTDPLATVTLMIVIFDPDNYNSGSQDPWGPNGNFYKQWWGSEWGGVYRELVMVDVTVPVELTSFTAQYIGSTTLLNWTTATELNNLGFDVQRSTEGNEFVTIGFVLGKGTTTEVQNYSYVDKTTTPNINYAYRLKQIDFNGSYNYSEVVNLGESNPFNFELLQNYPNPFNPATTISIGLPVKSDVTLDVYNIVGERVLSLYNGELAAGNYNYTVDASNLTSGIYIYVLNAVGEDGKNSTLSRKMTLLK
ncbi:MAG: T9SS type A sorting domain-containing protein [Ignavibacteriaceae bacterium]|nr:T9SS type A sorting domain-containing protein [Ignavibacteriaceae bacterium]